MAPNTGKTYAGFQRLKAARTGVYLAPLRLLALEAQMESKVCSRSRWEGKSGRRSKAEAFSTPWLAANVSNTRSAAPWRIRG